MAFKSVVEPPLERGCGKISLDSQPLASGLAPASQE